MSYAEMKYIVVNTGLYGECPIIFDKLLSHTSIAGSWTAVKINAVVSAGFLSVYEKDGKIVVGCYGKSDTLKIKAREEIDSALIQRQLIYVP